VLLLVKLGRSLMSKWRMYWCLTSTTCWKARAHTPTVLLWLKLLVALLLTVRSLLAQWQVLLAAAQAGWVGGAC
jgi:hypothetical protein